ncbi:MAG: arsenate reductase (glutaredoxin) [Hyphomicrobiaceae bacterium]|nr:arsenate reductase (glutaredoxin) [Hyphomicrobiaceae bacterium]
MTITIYHNPRCSKSRQTLALLEERGVAPQIVLYMQDTPTVSELKALLAKLGLTAQQLLRRKEAKALELGLTATDVSEDAVLAAMARHPELIERPIVVRGNKARLGRPPETVLDIL